MRRIVLTLTMLILLPLSAAFAQAGRSGNAMSPVGTWTIETIDDDPMAPHNWHLENIQFGGTATGGAWTAALSTGYSTWKKTGPHRYLMTTFVMFPDDNPDPPDEGGYIKDIKELWLIDKNTLEGRSEGWWVVGSDPLGPIVFGPLWGATLYGTRLEAEEKTIP